jgi:hypothetical protein
MDALRKADAYPPEALVFVGITLDSILCDVRHAPCGLFAILTAIGFASVLTNSDVIFSVRDMMGW